MGKASRNKKLKRQQAENIHRYGGIKLSEAIMNVSEPYDFEDLSLAEYKNLIGITSVAWNVARQDKDKRAEYLIDFIKRMPGPIDESDVDLNFFMVDDLPQDENQSDSVNILQMIKLLIQRKDELYPDDNRVVVNFNITEKANERHLIVSSAKPGTSKKSFVA